MDTKFLIGLNGKLGAGKDIIGDILFRYGYQKFSFGHHIRRELSSWWTLDNRPSFIPDGVRRTLYLVRDQERIRQALWQKPTTPELREALQWWGQYRLWLRPNYWVNLIGAEMRERKSDSNRAVITDVRMPIEYAFVKTLSGELWKVVRKPLEFQPFMTHCTESSIDDYDYDVIISNTTTVRDLELLVLQTLMDYDREAVSATVKGI